MEKDEGKQRVSRIRKTACSHSCSLCMSELPSPIDDKAQMEHENVCRVPFSLVHSYKVICMQILELFFLSQWRFFILLSTFDMPFFLFPSSYIHSLAYYMVAIYVLRRKSGIIKCDRWNGLWNDDNTKKNCVTHSHHSYMCRFLCT